MKARIFSLVLMAAILCTTVPVKGAASFDSFDASAENIGFMAAIDPPAVGSIPISNRKELAAISSNLSGKYHLTADIDLSDGEWAPIGGSNYFKGTLDGQGHVIRNLIVSSGSYGGLFRGLDSKAVVKNLGMENTQIKGAIESAGAICAVNRGLISNCYNTGSVSSVTSYYAYAGGICAVNGGLISNCYNTGSVSASSKYSATYAGGICGYTESEGVVNNCYNLGAISVSVSFWGSSAYAGGICGRNSANCTIRNCYNSGSVSASGTSYSPPTFYLGALCGQSQVNAVVGTSYWRIDSLQSIDGTPLEDSEKKGLGSGAGQATGLTHLQMQKQSSFSGWDFQTVWEMDVDYAYPQLRGMPRAGLENEAVKQRLADKIKEIDALKLNRDDYEPISWASFEAAYDAAETALAEDAGNYANLRNQLSSALDALVSYQDVLKALIKTASALNEKSYTKSSWQAFASALVVANGAVGKSASVIKQALTALEKAIDNLVPVNTAVLEAVIANAESLLADARIDTLPANVPKGEPFWLQKDVDALKIALTLAKSALDTEAQPGIDAAANALIDAVIFFSNAKQWGENENYIERPIVGTLPYFRKQYDGTPIDGLFLEAYSSDGGILSYDWYWADLDTNGVWGYLGRSTDGYLPTPGPSDPGMYQIEVLVTSHKNGLNSESVKVTGIIWIVSEPVITLPVKEIHVSEGEPVILNADVTTADGGTLFYWWHRADWSAQGPLERLDELAVDGITGNGGKSPYLVDDTPLAPGVYVYQLLVFNVRVLWPDGDGVIGNGYDVNGTWFYGGTWATESVWVYVD